ncbi:tail fiber domain-containing protein [Tenacibaculum maritimum]|uniref:tail fiber domain-containing protein n=1 Tax=Tenacibaculum maritimum TaxID=107401 RepID=UPI00387613E4
MGFHDTINTGVTPNDGKGDGLRTNIRKLIENDKFLKEKHVSLQDKFENVFKNNLIYNVKGQNQNYFKVLRLKATSVGAYIDRILLLLPAVTTNTSHDNKMYGRIIASKTGSNVWDTFEISAQSVYNKTFASFISTGQYIQHKLVTCTYNGVKWIALKFSYHANPYNNYWFEGFHVADPILDSNGDALKVVDYYRYAYNNNSAIVLNTEINNSIQDYASKTFNQISSELRINADVHCTSLIQTSDKKFKTNIELIDGAWALDVFKKLNFSFYDFSKTNSKQAGLIAQEVEKVLPQAVHTSDNGEKGLNYNYIDIVCKTAIQHFIKTQIQ